MRPAHVACALVYAAQPQYQLSSHNLSKEDAEMPRYHAHTVPRKAMRPLAWVHLYLETNRQSMFASSQFKDHLASWHLVSS
jgi:hypothetical protein